MSMLTIPSVEAQNSFGTLLDKSQRQIISVTRRGREVAFVMSPEVLEDYVSARISLLDSETDLQLPNEPKDKENGYDEWLVEKVSATKAMVSAGTTQLSTLEDARNHLQAKIAKKIQEKSALASNSSL